MGYHLLKAFTDTEVELSGLISRDLGEGMKTLEASKAKCGLIGGLHLAEVEADIIILAVPENAIDKVQRMYEFGPEQIIVHTSGSESMDSLHHERVGVFYPLQTLTWGKDVDFTKVPVLIEGSSISVEEKLLDLAQSISTNVSAISSSARRDIHLAAVLASNFPNHLFRKSEEILERHSLGLDLLSPLIIETLKKALSVGPANAQTGPARRGDAGTIRKHLEMITDPGLREIYELLSKDIRSSYE